MALIKIETDQPISSITINFANGLQGNADISVGGGEPSRMPTTDVPRDEPMRPDQRLTDRRPADPAGKSSDWHMSADDEMSRALETGDVDASSLEPEDDLLDTDGVDMSVAAPKVITPPVVMTEKPSGDRETSIDPNMAAASY